MMMRRVGSVAASAITAAAVTLSMPSMASAALDFDGTDNVVCLANSGANRYWCEDGGARQALTSWTINLLGGKDTLVVSSASCNCDCGGATDPFNYAGNTLTVNGGDDEDLLFGGDGQNAFNGEGGSDDIRTGSHNGDSITGAAGLDWIVDSSGTSETISSGDDADTIRDIGCSFTSINCGGSALDKCACGAGPTSYCNSGTCEYSAGPITISCPSI